MTVNNVQEYVPFDAGWYINQWQMFNDVSVEFFGLYEKCNLDFFVMQTGVYTQSLSGILNLATNAIFKIYVDADDTWKKT